MKIIFALIIIIASFSIAQNKSAEEILSFAEKQSKGETLVGTFTMNIVRPEYTRTLKMKNWNVGNEKALIEIIYPQKEKGNKTLKIGNEMWQYLKNTETTMKLPPSMMLRSWNGSDLTNDDLVRESNLVDDYDLAIISEEKIGGEMCWKIELKPKPDKPIVWGKLYYWVRQSDNLPAFVEYYDENNRMKRTMKFTDYKIIDGRKIPSKWIIKDSEKENNYTEFIFNEAEFNAKISEKIFSFRNLEK